MLCESSASSHALRLRSLGSNLSPIGCGRRYLLLHVVKNTFHLYYYTEFWLNSSLDVAVLGLYNVFIQCMSYISVVKLLLICLLYRN